MTAPPAPSRRRGNRIRLTARPAFLFFRPPSGAGAVFPGRFEAVFFPAPPVRADFIPRFPHQAHDPFVHQGVRAFPVPKNFFKFFFDAGRNVVYYGPGW